MAHPLKLLIVEDRLSDAELVVYELKRNSYDVNFTIVQDEDEYCAALEENPDLIIADHHLPRFDSTRALTLLNDAQLPIPFIVVSGAISEEMAVEAMRRGAADYLLKDRLTRLGPAVKHALEQRSNLLEKRRAEDALRESEEFNRGIVESSLDCIKVLSLEGALLSMNTGGQKLLEICDFESSRNQFWPNFWQAAADHQAALDAVVKGKAGATTRFQGYCPTQSGRPMWWDVVVTPIRDSGGTGRPTIGGISGYHRKSSD